MSIVNLLAEVPAKGTGQQGSIWPMIILMCVIWYFLFIYPPQKKIKKHRSLIDLLKSGDKIITNAGIFATVKKVEETKITVTIADKVDIDITKSSVAQVIQEERSTEKKK